MKNNWGSWFLKLKTDLSAPSNKELTNQMKDFRASHSVSELLRKSYPTERAIEKFVESKPPRRKTIDFVMSFLDVVHPHKSTAFAVIASAIIRTAQDKHKLSITRTFDAETFRRQSYWTSVKTELESQMEGFYYLLRCNEHNECGYEVAYLKSDETFAQMMIMFWLKKADTSDHLTGDKVFCIGNLYVGQDYFNGTLLKHSTDSLMNPVSIMVLKDGDASSGLPIYTGTITGTSEDRKSIFHYPIALQKVEWDNDGILVNEDNFVSLAKDVENLPIPMRNNTGLHLFLTNKRRITRSGDIARALRSQA